MDAWSGALSLRLLGRRAPGTVHSTWKAPECEAARHKCTHTPAHTHTRATLARSAHTHRHLGRSVGAFPNPGARVPAPASVLALPTGTRGCAHPPPSPGAGDSVFVGAYKPQGRPSLRPVPTYLQSWDRHPSPWVCGRGAGTRAAPGLRPQPRGGVLRVTHRDVFRS